MPDVIMGQSRRAVCFADKESPISFVLSAFFCRRCRTGRPFKKSAGKRGFDQETIRKKKKSPTACDHGEEICVYIDR